METIEREKIRKVDWFEWKNQDSQWRRLESEEESTLIALRYNSGPDLLGESFTSIMEKTCRSSRYNLGLSFPNVSNAALPMWMALLEIFSAYPSETRPQYSLASPEFDAFTHETTIHISTFRLFRTKEASIVCIANDWASCL